MATRRQFLKVAGAVAGVAAGSSLGPAHGAAGGSSQASTGGASPIDRQALVRRHNPVLTDFDARSPLSVGNGEFAFTVDPTGLQTFPAFYEAAMPLGTQSQWGWQTDGAAPPGELKLEEFDAHGRSVGYATGRGADKALYNWLRENPHRAQLATIGFDLQDRAAITDIHQTLDLWTGVIESRFQLRGHAVRVETCCHPTRDAIAVRISGDAPKIRYDIRDPKLVRVAPRAAADPASGGRAASIPLSFVCEFSRSGFARPELNVDETFAASRAHWAHFWSTGGAIDFSGCPGERAHELERRVVLSQYLTAIQCAGSTPPQETGLTCNSWYGKFHLEMHWWHAAHFPLWGRAPLLERSLDWYLSIMPSARERAKQQGYAGVRWPKMTDPSGRDSPSPIGPLLIWQQPHPLAMLELCYAAHPSSKMIAKYSGMVHETAEFMASYAYYDASGDRFMLGPPVIPAQENHPPRETWNPTFELAYWKRGLQIAQQWRVRAGMPREKNWDRVIAKMSALPVRDGVYLAHENCPQTFTERNHDHPSMLAALGVLPSGYADAETMRRTLHKVLKEWHWEDTWGWDFPMTAMTAARLGEPDTAIDALFIASQKNTWLPNGHVYQRPNLPLYLPANGGLLTAIAVLAATKAFPANWPVKHEGLRDIA